MRDDIAGVQVTEMIDRLVSTTSVDAAWAVLTKAMASYGFDKLFYGFTRFNTKNSVGDRDDLLLLSSMPGDYTQRYIEGEMYRNAPMTRWARENVGAMSWSWISENLEHLAPEQLKVLEFNQSFDVIVGYTIAFKDAQTRHKGAIALTAQNGLSQDDVNAIWTAKGFEINVLNQVAHLKFTTLPLPGSMSKLSARQREVLEWVGDGKTMQDIATILGLTQATVEKHLRNARDILGVETTAQAVRKASILNHIFVVNA